MPDIPLDKVLIADRVRLRVVSLSDIDLVWSASRYKGFNDGMVWDPPASKEELISITHKNLEAWSHGESFVYTIELIESNTPIGRIAIRTDGGPLIWNIGFWIHPEYQSRGYATESAKAILKFGFIELNATAITTAHAVWNTPSKKVIEKLGFKFLRQNPAGFIKAGKTIPEFEYEIERDMFELANPVSE